MLTSSSTAAIVGANNGKSFDEFFHIVEHSPATLVLVEPLTHFHGLLQDTFKSRAHTVICPYGISDKAGEETLYFIPQGEHADWYSALGSLYRDRNQLRPDYYNDSRSAEIQGLIQETIVKLVTPDTMMKDCRLSSIDYLQVDTEGHDAIVVSAFLNSNIVPPVVKFEHAHLPPAESVTLTQLLKQQSYFLIQMNHDTLAIQKSALCALLGAN